MSNDPKPLNPKNLKPETTTSWTLKGLALKALPTPQSGKGRTLKPTPKPQASPKPKPQNPKALKVGEVAEWVLAQNVCLCEHVLGLVGFPWSSNGPGAEDAGAAIDLLRRKIFRT